MSVLQAQAGVSKEAPAASRTLGIILRYLGLVILDAFALLLVYALAADGIWELAVAIVLITIFVNVVNIRDELFPIRWMSPALALMLLMVVYPIIYTIYVSFTNYGDRHLLTQTQAIERISQVQYLPEGGTSYSWEAYQAEDGTYALWLTDPDGNAFFAVPGQELQAVTVNESGEEPYNDDGLPQTIDGFTLLDRAGRSQLLRAQDAATSAGEPPLEFGTDSSPIGIKSRSTAGPFGQRYTYDTERDGFLDNQTGVFFAADAKLGEFVADDGSGTMLLTGYRTLVGLDNFTRFLTSPVVSGPLLEIFIWTVMFALLSVISTFATGLLFALLLQAKTPGARLFRTLLIVPYAIPALISVAVWKGMLNPNFGVINNILNAFGLSAPPFFADPTWARVGILLINLWLGYPYFMLVCSGALAAIPSDMYEAARVDGANVWNQFRFLTFPMLLVSVGPLLIASFTYNFNNFVIIDVYNEGGPPRIGTTTPAGHTDILISYAFRLAFGTGRGADFGLASAITIIIFLMVMAVTLFQFRFTKSWEETSKNV